MAALIGFWKKFALPLEGLRLVVEGPGLGLGGERAELAAPTKMIQTDIVDEPTGRKTKWCQAAIPSTSAGH
jgi:hypothetical protein